MEALKRWAMPALVKGLLQSRVIRPFSKFFTPKAPELRPVERSPLADFFHQHYQQLLIAVLFVLLGVLLFPAGKSFQFADLREGEVYDGEQIIAPFTFSIDKTAEEYHRDVRLARESVYPVFIRDDSAEAQELRALENFLTGAEQNIEALVPDSMKTRRLRDVFATQPKLVISDEGLSFLVRGFTRGERPASANGRFSVYAAQLNRICRDLFAIGILSVERSALPNYVLKISVRRGGDEMVEAVEQFHDVESVNAAALQKLREVENLSDPAINLGYQILTNFLRPNLFYDERETQLRLNEAESKVARARGTVLAKERIIDSHDKITPEHLQKLRSLATEMAKLHASEGGIARLLPVAGRIFILFIGAGILGVFLLHSRPAIYQDAYRVLLIAFILLLVMFVGFLINVVNLSEYLIPVAMASMLLIFFFDAQLAFVGTVALGIVLGGMRGYEFSTIFTTLLAGSVSILAVRRVRSRSWIFKAILFLALAYLIIISTTAFLRYTPFKQALLNLGDGMINALLCPIFTYGVMVIFEYLFDLTTDATLLELSALNRPLLRELAIQAPGTYHHSIVVGTLSEDAAEAIGANSLLARVGAYYHDIGKMEMAEYFVENQRGGKNPHEKLTPNMSLLVIINHVKRGVEIAEENDIPKEVRDFIPQHHGTNLLSYFYKKALEKNGDTEVQESDFRYPGPKPQSKETGIVMLADAIEAAARALRDPSISRIRNIVNSIVEERFKKGELDECPLTLRDLNLIKESFIRTLMGIFHGRIQYPEDKNLAPPDARRQTSPTREAEAEAAPGKARPRSARPSSKIRSVSTPSSETQNVGAANPSPAPRPTTAAQDEA